MHMWLFYCFLFSSAKAFHPWKNQVLVLNSYRNSPEAFKNCLSVSVKTLKSVAIWLGKGKILQLYVWYIYLLTFSWGMVLNRYFNLPKPFNFSSTCSGCNIRWWHAAPDPRQDEPAPGEGAGQGAGERGRSPDAQQRTRRHALQPQPWRELQPR